MDAGLRAELSRFISQQGLPEDYIAIIQEYLLPLAEWIASRKREKPLVTGINGAQGSGKSTLTAALAIILEHCHGFKVATLSIDDLYLTRYERLKLAEEKHPLLKTRGVPGTHDVRLGIDTIHRLISASGDVLVPRFDKYTDDRMPEPLWSKYQAPVDMVLFEGWCLATPPQSQLELIQPVNELERMEDDERHWREFVNDSLAGGYQQLFDLVDALVFVKAPGFNSVLQWRSAQEHKTFKAHEEEGMNIQQLTHFVQHYERLTRVSLERLPGLADVVLELNGDQQITRAIYKS